MGRDALKKTLGEDAPKPGQRLPAQPASSPPEVQESCRPRPVFPGIYRIIAPANLSLLADLQSASKGESLRETEVTALPLGWELGAEPFTRPLES